MSHFFSILDIVSQLNRKQCYDAQLLNKLSYVKRCYVLCVIGNEAEIGNFFSGLVEVDGNHTINTQPRIHTHTHTQIRNILLYIIIHVLQALCVIEMRVNQFSSIEDEKKIQFILFRDSIVMYIFLVILSWFVLVIIETL